MSIDSLSGIGGNQQTQGIQRASDRLQAAIANLVGNQANATDVATLSIAAQLQNSTAGLTQASANLAQATSLTQIASAGTTQIQDALGQLQSLASEASSPTLNSSDRAALNQQFQQIVGTVDQLATGTNFNNQSLLDGTIAGGNALSLNSLLGDAGDGSGQDVTLTIPALTPAQLFGGASPNLLSAGSAQDAFSTVGNAINQVTSAQANIASFQQATDFAAANVDSAANNQQAAISNLSDPDFTAAASNVSAANIQENLNVALAAQGNHLTSAILNLIN